MEGNNKKLSFKKLTISDFDQQQPDLAKGGQAAFQTVFTLCGCTGGCTDGCGSGWFQTSWNCTYNGCTNDCCNK